MAIADEITIKYRITWKPWGKFLFMAVNIPRYACGAVLPVFFRDWMVNIEIENA